jgi:hypothetical protein
VHPAPAPAPALGHRRTGESPRVYAAFLQNAPVVRPTRGFTTGWYAVPCWGTPNSAQPPEPPPPPRPQRHHHNTPGQRRLFFLNGDNHPPLRDRPPSNPAAAGPGRSEHRNVDILIPVARPRESPTGPNVPCERRTDPAEPRRGTYPQRQPQHSATAKQFRAPGCMRRSLRTLRLCCIPGVSPRAGMRCPVGALRTPHNLQSPHRLHVPSDITTTHRISDDCFSSTATIKPFHTGTCPQATKRQRDRAGASIGTSTS